MEGGAREAHLAREIVVLVMVESDAEQTAGWLKWGDSQHLAWAVYRVKSLSGKVEFVVCHNDDKSEVA